MIPYLALADRATVSVLRKRPGHAVAGPVLVTDAVSASLVRLRVRRSPMTDIIRHCPDCDRDLHLEQHHSMGGWCPDTADARCPEWYCQLCGAALLIGTIPAALEPVMTAPVRQRVA
jgi:hypothetical protein